MRRLTLLLATIGFAAAFLAAEHPAQAQMAYVYGSDALPWHYSVRNNVPAGESNTETNRPSPFGLDSLAFGAGIGYSGLNGQLDIHNAVSIWTGAVTIGIREGVSLGPIEIWGRLGGGLGLVFDGIKPKLNTTGGIVTDFEAGANWWFINHLSVGVKAVATPQYSFPSTFSADIALLLEIRARF